MGAMSACSRVGHPSWVILNIRLTPPLPLPHTSGVEARSTKRRWVTHADSLTSDSRTFPLPTHYATILAKVRYRFRLPLTSLSSRSIFPRVFNSKH